VPAGTESWCRGTLAPWHLAELKTPNSVLHSRNSVDHNPFCSFEGHRNERNSLLTEPKRNYLIEKSPESAPFVIRFDTICNSLNCITQSGAIDFRSPITLI